MNELELVRKCNKKLAELKCPQCKRGWQVEDRNCLVGYTQYRCTNCGYVEPYKDKLARAISKMVEESERDGN